MPMNYPRPSITSSAILMIPFFLVVAGTAHAAEGGPPATPPAATPAVAPGITPEAAQALLKEYAGFHTSFSAVVAPVTAPANLKAADDNLLTADRAALDDLVLKLADLRQRLSKAAPAAAPGATPAGPPEIVLLADALTQATRDCATFSRTVSLWRAKIDMELRRRGVADGQGAEGQPPGAHPPALSEADEKMLLEKAKYAGDKQAARKLSLSGSVLWFTNIIEDVKKAGFISGVISDEQIRLLSAYPDEAFKRLGTALLESDKDFGFRILNAIIRKDQPTLALAREVAQSRRREGGHDRSYMAPTIFAWVKDRPGNDQIICDAVVLFGILRYKEAIAWTYQKQQIGDEHLVQIWGHDGKKHSPDNIVALLDDTILGHPAINLDAGFLGKTSDLIGPQAGDIVIAAVAAEALARLGAAEHVESLRKTYDGISKWRLDDLEPYGNMPGYTGINRYQSSLRSYLDTLRAALAILDPGFLDQQLASLIAPVEPKPQGYTISQVEYAQNRRSADAARAVALYRFMAKEGRVQIVARMTVFFLKHSGLHALTDPEARTWIENDAYWQGITDADKVAIADQLAAGITAASEAGRLASTIPEDVDRQIVRVQSDELSMALIKLLGQTRDNASVTIARYAATIEDKRFIDAIKGAIDRATFDEHKRQLQAAVVTLMKP